MSATTPETVGRLAGRTALVTGGSIGIGAAIVRLFAKEGANVVFCARSELPGKDLSLELTSAGYRVQFARCDATREDQVRSLIKQTVEWFGGLDILVNNAGISKLATIEETSLEDWDRILRTNLTSMFLMSRESIPLLRKSTYPSIINLGSTYSVVGAPGAGAYGLTKAAAASFTQTLAIELAPHIRVNALCPGATATRLYDDFIATHEDAAKAQAEVRVKHPLGRVGQPEDMAGGALYLASEDASYVTGHALLVDGGYTAQ